MLNTMSEIKKAFEIKVGDTIYFQYPQKRKFVVDDIVKTFLNDDVAKLYAYDSEVVKNEHTAFTFYDVKDRCICDVNFDTEFLCL